MNVVMQVCLAHDYAIVWVYVSDKQMLEHAYEYSSDSDSPIIPIINISLYKMFINQL